MVDHNDGSYTVSYKPSSSAKLLISVSLNTEMLPGCPFVCVVHAPTPSASQCIVHGTALTNAVAHHNEHFFVSFRDALGQMTHAGELLHV